MKGFNVMIIAYSLLLMIGGVTGYIMAASVASLLMSCIFAILLLSALFLIPLWPNFALRSINGLLVILTLFFAYRWYVTKFFPAGLVCLVSLLVLILALLMKRQPAAK